MNLPTVSSYGRYSSGNYGVNTLKISFPNHFTIWYSYETVVAFLGREGLKVRQNDWSTTTGKHLNWIDGGQKEKRLAGAEFETLLQAELAYYNLL